MAHGRRAVGTRFAGCGSSGSRPGVAGRSMDSHPSQEKRIPDELARYLNELRTRVHRYRRYGLLPEGRGTLRLRARRGSGLTCLVCGEPVLASEPEIIIECESDPELSPETPTYRLHHLCHVIWLTESHPKRRGR
jgi:hypothetical protein